MTFEAFHCGVKCSVTTLSSNRIITISRRSQIVEAIRFLKHLELNAKQEIFHQQIKSMNSNKITHRKYSVETVVRTFEYFCLSRNCYSRLRRDFELPSISALSRLTSITKNTDDTTFLQSVIFSLNDRQKNAVLLIDEVFVKPTLQYCGGTLFGRTANKPMF